MLYPLVCDHGNTVNFIKMNGLDLESTRLRARRAVDGQQRRQIGQVYVAVRIEVAWAVGIVDNRFQPIHSIRMRNPSVL